MKAIITSYRRGRRTSHNNQVIIKSDEVKTRENAGKQVGNKVKYTTKSGKEMKGKITHPHGNNGAMLARFRKGLPGQALGEKVEVGE